MILSVVTGTYNRLEHLRALIESVRASLPRGLSYEVIIVDGGSNDGTIAYCLAQLDVRLIQQGELLGAVAAFNAGAYAATGKYVLLANDDIRFDNPLSIMRAIAHLEDNPTCGAVAFADNRPAEGKTGYKVMGMPGVKDGKSHWVPYAQVGLFRRWLGDLCGWWSGTRGMVSRTYGADNALSCEIWARGYTVDPVEGVIVTDNVVDDDLRQSNRFKGDGSHPDSIAFQTTYPRGADINSLPTPENPDTRLVRVMYCPVYENHPIQRQTKRGLREALARRYLTVEYDYLARLQQLGAGRFQLDFYDTLRAFRPDILLTQLHDAQRITADMLLQARLILPHIIIVNWNGDVYEKNLLEPSILEMLRYVDLQTVVNASALPHYAAQGIPAAYWQVAPEPVDEPLPDVPAYDLVFLANGYSPQRHELGACLRELSTRQGFTLGIYGSGWPDGWASGDTTYHFSFGRALYRNAKLALSDNQYAAEGFVSNRLFEALAAGGAVVLQQEVPELEKWTGLTAGVHYVSFKTLDDLGALIEAWFAPDELVRAGQTFFVHNALSLMNQRHTFDARVKELFGANGLLAAMGKRPIAAPRTFLYSGNLAFPFGVVGRHSGKQYVVYSNVLTVAADDAITLLTEPNIWSEIE